VLARCRVHGRLHPPRCSGLAVRGGVLKRLQATVDPMSRVHALARFHGPHRLRNAGVASRSGSDVARHIVIFVVRLTDNPCFRCRCRRCPEETLNCAR
jgi:hypothetical protein